VGFVAGFALVFGAGTFFPGDFPALDFCVVVREAFALVVEAGCPLGLVAFTAGLGFFVSAIPVDLTCSGYDSLRRL